MGLDQYAYVSARAGAQAEYYGDENYGKDDSDPTKLSEPREIAYWRKHPNLHGWMEQLWLQRNPGILDDPDAVFNGVELELTNQDIEDLELAVRHGQLPSTSGFFFGQNSDNVYLEQDLEFCRQARFELFVGLKVFYNSSW
jgi:hypothetical protein